MLSRRFSIKLKADGHDLTKEDLVDLASQAWCSWLVTYSAALIFFAAVVPYGVSMNASHRTVQPRHRLPGSIPRPLLASCPRLWTVRPGDSEWALLLFFIDLVDGAR